MVLQLFRVDQTGEAFRDLGASHDLLAHFANLPTLPDSPSLCSLPRVMLLWLCPVNKWDYYAALAPLSLGVSALKEMAFCTQCNEAVRINKCCCCLSKHMCFSN